MEAFRNIVEGHLAEVYQKRQIEQINEKLQMKITEIRKLKKILSICSKCNKIQTESDNWVPFEQYFSDYDNTSFSHGLCQMCYQEYKEKM